MINPEQSGAPPDASARARTARRPVALILALLMLATGGLAGAAGALRVAVISDLNGSYGSTNYEASVGGAVARILELEPDLVISTGDMVAGQRRPHLDRLELERMWKAFHAQVSDRLAAAGIPLAVTPGNHDGSAYEGFELERSIYREQWTPRNPGVHFIDKAGYPLYYAFTVGDSLFISLDATTVGHLPRAQMDWLRTILAEYGAERQRRVVFSHVPLWPFTRGRERESIGDPELEALLAAADVDLYLSGHHHAFYPGVKDGIAFVSQSCLGAGPRRLIGAQNKSGRGFTWLEFTDSETRIAAYQGPKFESTIDWETLPPRIHGVGGDMVRADLAPGVITPLGPTGSQ